MLQFCDEGLGGTLFPLGFDEAAGIGHFEEDSRAGF